MSEIELAEKVETYRKFIKLNSLHKIENEYYKIYGVGINGTNKELLMYYCKVYTNNYQITTNIDSLSKLSDLQLQELEIAKNSIVIGDLYYHYTDIDIDRLYKVIGVGYDHTTNNIKVIYQALFGSKLIWLEDLSSWNETILGIPKFIKVYNSFSKYVFYAIMIATVVIILSRVR